MNLLSHAEAVRTGAREYYTGKPCPHGHIAPRRVRDRRCVQCRKKDKKKEQASGNWKTRARKEMKKYGSTPENKHKRKIRNLLTYAIRKGDIVPQPCSVCGSEKSHGHHDDYSKPYDIIWLCPTHHSLRHKQLAEEGIIL